MTRVLIIGATSAIAAEVARNYAASGVKLYLIARDSEKLSELVGELGSCVLGTATYDFCAFENGESIIQNAWKDAGGFEKALIAQGYLGDQLKSESELDEAQRMITVNYTSVVSQLIILGALFRQQKFGQIAAITSVAGERGRPRNFTYGSAKKAVSIYLQGLRSALYPHVDVTEIRLGPVDTPMTRSHQKNFSFITKEKAAHLIIRVLAAKKNVAYVPGFWLLVMFVVKLLPEPLFQKFRFLSSR